MSSRRARWGMAATPLAYWLLVVAGLAMLVWRRSDLDEVLPVCCGTVLGTALGQTIARLRLRMWLGGLAFLGCVWVGAILFAAQQSAGIVAGPFFESALLAFAPATLCGYLALTERGGLAAFWFPTMLWMLTLLDGPSAVGAVRRFAGWGLLSLLGIFFLAFCRAREMRRVALWQGPASVPLADEGTRTVLRSAPSRGVRSLGWAAGVAAATVWVTGAVAPRLWHKEPVDRTPEWAWSSTGWTPVVDAPVASRRCCEPTGGPPRERVEEYFSLARVVGSEGPSSADPPCVACTGSRASTGVEDAPVAIDRGPTTYAHGRSPAASPEQRNGPGRSDDPGMPAWVDPPPPPPASAGPSASPVGPSYPSAHEDPPVVAAGVAALRAPFAPLDGWGRALLLAAAILALVRYGGRSLRRWTLLRHLRQPLWAESVDQRVSNLWQLALVGLRDAGWRVAPGEPPHEVAGRVGIDGLDTCADVLDRVRHGVRVEPDDLRAMAQAARSVYRAARGQAGVLGRALGWLRWPAV